MGIGLNILRPERGNTECERFNITGRGLVYTGRNPRTFDNPAGLTGMKEKPWVIRHPDCDGRYYKAIGIQCYATLRIREGVSIGVLAREWDESIDGPIVINEYPALLRYPH